MFTRASFTRRPYAASGAIVAGAAIRVGRLAYTRQPYSNLFSGSAPAAVPFVPSFDWFQPFSEPPVKTKLGLLPSQQQSFAAPPRIIVSFGWFEPLSEPSVKTRPGLRPGAQPFSAFVPVFWPFVGRRQFTSQQFSSLFVGGQGAQRGVTLTVPPLDWFVPWSEPVVKTKRGLLPSQQQSLAYVREPNKTPNITGTLHAIETKDTMRAGGRMFNRPTTARSGLIERKFTGLSGIIPKSS